MTDLEEDYPSDQADWDSKEEDLAEVESIDWSSFWFSHFPYDYVETKRKELEDCFGDTLVLWEETDEAKVVVRLGSGRSYEVSLIKGRPGWSLRQLIRYTGRLNGWKKPTTIQLIRFILPTQLKTSDMMSRAEPSDGTTSRPEPSDGTTSRPEPKDFVGRSSASRVEQGFADDRITFSWELKSM